MTDKAIQIWFGVNKQDYLQLFLDEPKKDMKVGKYVGKYPFVNSLWYDEMYKMIFRPVIINLIELLDSSIHHKNLFA